jgi:signal transduction histidine kinase
VVYIVEDDGPGVRNEEEERIFEPGVRGHAQNTSGEGGAGPGLALARRLAAAPAATSSPIRRPGEGAS